MPPMRTRWLAAALLATAACRSATRAPPPPPAPPAPEAQVVTSNVERRDYAGSTACAPCHSEIYAKWSASPMRRMTRHASADTPIHAPFDGAVFHFKGDRVTMEQHEGRRYMRVSSKEGGEQLFRVTRVIGGRYREDFTGYRVTGTEPDSDPVGGPAAEPVLPVSWLIFAKAWRYKGYSVMVEERAHLAKHGVPWRQTCIFCHNTEPYLATIVRRPARRPAARTRDR